jgi:hypothetical protein
MSMSLQGWLLVIAVAIAGMLITAYFFGWLWAGGVFVGVLVGLPVMLFFIAVSAWIARGSH